MSTKPNTGGDSGGGDPQGGGLPAPESYPGLSGHLEVDTEAQHRGAALLQEIADHISTFASGNSDIVTYRPLVGDPDDPWEKFEPGYVKGATAFLDFANSLSTAGQTLAQSVLLYAQLCSGTEDAAEQIGFGALLFNDRGAGGEDDEPLPRPKPYLGGPDPQQEGPVDQPRATRAMRVATRRDAVPPQEETPLSTAMMFTVERDVAPQQEVPGELRRLSLAMQWSEPAEPLSPLVPAELGSEPGELLTPGPRGEALPNWAEPQRASPMLVATLGERVEAVPATLVTVDVPIPAAGQSLVVDEPDSPPDPDGEPRRS
ncbi:hypothetical protein [Lentzea sp. NPDC055074]